MVTVASSMGLQMLGFIGDCEQGEQEGPGAERRGDPRKGQGMW